MVRIALLALLFAAFVPHSALAEETKDDGPGIISMGLSGILPGAAVGGSAGYLMGRRDGWKKSDWRAVGLGLGIGALSGAGFGIILGVINESGGKGARYVARDFGLGVGFGALIGVIGGGIAAARQHHAEYALFGTCIGAISGAGLGILTGIIEGAARRRNAGETTTTTTTTTSKLHLEPAIDFVPAKANSLGTPVTGFRGTF